LSRSLGRWVALPLLSPFRWICRASVGEARSIYAGDDSDVKAVAPLAPTAAPTPPPGSTPGAPTVFSQLTNGGFEDDGANGAPQGWRKIGGTAESTSSPVRSGNRALALTSETTATKWAYQTVAVDGGQFYQAGAFARYTDADVKAVFLRTSWYASADGRG